MAKLLNHFMNDPMITFACPACPVDHYVNVEQDKPLPEGTPKWSYNNDPEKPTFTPSVVCNFRWNDEPVVCHFFVKDGMIEFLPDCTHELAGKTVPMVPYEE